MLAESLETLGMASSFAKSARISASWAVRYERAAATPRGALCASAPCAATKTTKTAKWLKGICSAGGWCSQEVCRIMHSQHNSHELCHPGIIHVNYATVWMNRTVMSRVHKTPGIMPNANNSGELCGECINRDMHGSELTPLRSLCRHVGLGQLPVMTRAW